MLPKIFVAPMTKTCFLSPHPSIRVRNCVVTCLFTVLYNTQKNNTNTPTKLPLKKTVGIEAV
jgi:hypothetical protein